MEFAGVSCELRVGGGGGLPALVGLLPAGGAGALFGHFYQADAAGEGGAHRGQAFFAQEVFEA